MLEKKDTDYLEKILQNVGMKNFDQYLDEEDILPEYTLHAYFNDYIADYKLHPADIIERSGLSREYAYQILNGRKKHPSRDKIIALGIGARMSLKEMQRALKIAGQGILYAKNERDAAIMACIHDGIYKMEDINHFLSMRNLEQLQ